MLIPHKKPPLSNRFACTPMLVVGLLLPVNVSSFAPITFDTAELCVVTLNDKA